MKKIFKKIFALLLIVFISFAVVGCKDDDTPVNKTIKVVVTASADTIKKGETVTMTVVVSNATDTSYTWSISDTKLVAIENNVVSVIADVTENKTVTLTAISDEDNTKSASKTLTIVTATDPIEEVSVTVSSSADTIKKGETVTMSVTVTNATNTAYTWTISDTSLVSITNNVVSVIADVTENKTVTLTAVSSEDNTKTGSKTLTIVPAATPIEKVVKVEVTSSTDTIKKGETVTMTVTVSNATDTTYTWTISDTTLVAINNNVVSVIADVKVDKIVTLTATSNEDNTKSASKTLKIVAPIVEGEVGELTSEMLKKISNSSITATGILTDYYTDFKQNANSTKNEYNMTVEMADGAWNGSWNVKGNTSNIITDCYRKGSVDGLTDQYGVTGHALEKLFINKNNEISSSMVKDYLSIPSIWEAQHLWNHLGNLQISNFTYDVENEVYKYNYKSNNLDDLLLLTYLSISLTPMLEDTLVDVYLVVEDGEITGLIAQTEILYYGENSEEDPDAMSYTTISVNFSDVGTTTVKNPEPYNAPDYADKLQAALTNMGKAENYTFAVTDVTTTAPSNDSSDYEVESTNSVGRVSNTRTTSRSVANNDSSVGTVGCYGQVTKDAVLFADTIKYSYTLDGKAFHTEYTGYKQNMDGSYDHFAYSSTNKGFVGTKKVTGSMFDILPQFDFSANIFTFTGLTTKNNKTYYTYSLNDSTITRDLALEVSAYKYADDANASSSTRFTITVDSDGNVVSTVFPYSIINGTYIGYCTTTYSNIGTTELEEGIFDNYVPRVLKKFWSDYIVKYYSATFSTLDSHDEDASVVLEAVYGDSISDLPAPSVIMNIVGDNINGPFFDYNEKGVDGDGKKIYSSNISITTSSSEYDENGKITNYEELMQEFQTALEAEGFTLSRANTDTTGGESGLSNKYVTFIKNDIQIVIENNNTKYLWIYFYKTGDWTLTK